MLYITNTTTTSTVVEEMLRQRVLADGTGCVEAQPPVDAVRVEAM